MNLGTGARWRSIDRRLPLLISALLLATVSAFTLAAYFRIEHLLLATASQRLRSASLPISLLLAEAAARREAALSRAASDPAIREFLATGRERDAAARVLAGVWATPTARGGIQLRDVRGAVVLDTSRVVNLPGSGWVERQIASGAVSADSAVTGPFQAVGDTVFTEAVAAVMTPAPRGGGRAPGSRSVVGWVSDVGLISAQGAQTIRELIGSNAVILVGTPDGAWSDLERRAAPPPAGMRPGQTLIFDDSPRGAGIGAATPVRGTSWILWVQQPRGIALAPMRDLLVEIAALAALFIAAGALGAWILSRRITRPILRLTEAAERIAAHDTAPLASPGGHDELERLSEAFARMSARVNESQHELEQRVAERTMRLEHANEELSHAQAMLVQKERLAMLGQLASAVGHELRNPLGVMTNALYVIEQSTTGAPPIVREYIELLRGQISASERIVGDLLDTARVRPPQTEAVSLYDLVDAQLRRMGPLAGIDVRRELPLDLPFARIDPAQVSQIVLNLLANAVQAMSEKGGGTLSVTARTSDSDRLLLEIADTGPGIPRELIERIFEPLFTTKARGLGLGLWVSRTLAEANNAELRVTSTQGEGSVFTLDMPAQVTSRLVTR
ncbi:MAG TPA: ATP-binding protein [Gemmatimonadaceae bacterium]|nr:ATP-binding protein [Gemmatimonadaceae bacterium]